MNTKWNDPSAFPLHGTNMKNDSSELKSKDSSLHLHGGRSVRILQRHNPDVGLFDFIRNDVNYV